MEQKTADKVKRTKRQVTNPVTLPPSEQLRFMMKHGTAPDSEHLETEGQQELLAANGASLPILGSDHPCFAQMGLVFGEPLDQVFREAKLPQNWGLRASREHVMVTDLLDVKGRRRAKITYKSALFDRHAEIEPTVRYTVGVEYQGKFGIAGESHRGYVFDHATRTEVFSTKTLRREGQDRTFLKTEELKQETAQWISARFPDHQDPAAYWD